MKQYNLIIDNIECGKIIYHLENKREIEVFETCKKIYVDSY